MLSEISNAATLIQEGHSGGAGSVVLALTVVLGAAKLAGHLAVRLGQPAVLGELIAGVILGNAVLVGIRWFEGFPQDPGIELLAELGVVILLFEVGLESTVRDMLKVGLSSLLVALLGLATPFALGWAVGAWLLPHQSTYVHAFLGATLTATSVGITARVLGDLGKSKTPEARIILGAAVIDDILGLVILAIVMGVVRSAERNEVLGLGSTAWILVKAVTFLFGALIIGSTLSPRLFRFASRLRGDGVLLTTALFFCFLLSYLASTIGLAMIVGAYAAGLILEHVHWRDFSDRGERQLEELIRPIATLLVPVFFVLMGMRVDLRTFARVEVLGLAAALTLAAIVGKQVCSFGALGKGLDRLSIGIGMIPRGEVGLIFAGIGATLTLHGESIVSESTFSAIVIMVIVTTMVTPPALKWSLSPRSPVASMEEVSSRRWSRRRR